MDRMNMSRWSMMSRVSMDRMVRRRRSKDLPPISFIVIMSRRGMTWIVSFVGGTVVAEY